MDASARNNRFAPMSPEMPQQGVPTRVPKAVIWTILVVLVAGVIGLSYYLYQKDIGNSNTNVGGNVNASVNSTANQNVNGPSNTNTMVNASDWKTYTNTKYQYSFKYPQGFTLLDSPSSSTPDPESPTIGFGNTDMGFRVSIQTVESCESLSTCVQRYPYSNASLGVSGGLSQAAIDEHQALTETISRPQTGNWTHHVWYVLREGQLYTFSTVSATSFDPQALPTYNAIISSITF